MKSRLAALIFVALVCAMNLSAATIFDGGTYDTSQYAGASNVNCGQFCQVVGGQFSLTPGENVITDVHWAGTYYPSAFTDNFTINIFNFVSGNPSTVPVDSFNIGSSATRTDTGNTDSFNAEIYSYDVNISPTTLVAGDPYMLSIVYNEAPGATQDWGWSLGGSAVAWTYTQAQGWSETTSQHIAFTLTGPVSTATPEPGSMALLGTGLVAAAGSLRRKMAKK